MKRLWNFFTPKIQRLPMPRDMAAEHAKTARLCNPLRVADLTPQQKIECQQQLMAIKTLTYHLTALRELPAATFGELLRDTIAWLVSEGHWTVQDADTALCIAKSGIPGETELRDAMAMIGAVQAMARAEVDFVVGTDEAQDGADITNGVPERITPADVRTAMGMAKYDGIPPKPRTMQLPTTPGNHTVTFGEDVTPPKKPQKGE